MFNLWKKKKSVFPDADWFEEIERETDFTPDIWRLERYQFQLMFIYGEMMRQHQMHSMVEEFSVPLAKGFTQGKYSLWKKNLGNVSFPIALDVPFSGAPLEAIKGELYAIQTSQYINLDKFKLNGYHFLRQRVPIVIPYREIGGYEQSTKIQAWMYVGISDYWVEQLDAGYLFSPVRVFKPSKAWTDKYYYFSIMEYESNNK